MTGWKEDELPLPRPGGAGFGVQLLEEWITSGAAARFAG